jgi:hypothetical protein
MLEHHMKVSTALDHAFEQDSDSDCTGLLFVEDERMSEAPIMVNN